MIDFHTHILPAIDDGAVSIDDSITMAKSLAAFGYKTVCCTPHCIKGYYDLSPDKVREATLILQADLDNANVELNLWPGMEYMLDDCFPQFAEDLLPLGDTRLVLCEAPPQTRSMVVQENLELIVSKGFVPLVAHPERTQFFYEKLMVKGEGEKEKSEIQNPESLNLKQKKNQGFLSRIFSKKTTEPLPFNPVPQSNLDFLENCLFQANLGSFTGFYGQGVQRKAYDLLKINAYTALASDLHDSRSCNLVLVYDKFAMNPILKKLAAFDGVVPEIHEKASQREGEQGSLF